MPKGVYNHKKSYVLTPKRLEHIKSIGFPKGHKDFVTNEGRERIRLSARGNKYRLGFSAWNKGLVLGKNPVHSERMKGRVVSEETRKKISGTLKDICHRPPVMYGDKNPNWKGGIENHDKRDERNDPAYQKWVRLVKKRDSNICAFKGQNCAGYNIVHHILPWRDYPEERYNIKNGITLCHFHHPRKWSDEIKLMPIFQGLVMVREQL